MKNFTITLLFLLCIQFSFQKNLAAQDIHFSQFSETPLLQNPGLAGIFNGDVRLQAVFRSQWGSVTVPFQTTSLNGEYKMPVGKGYDYLTIGGIILYDKAGTISLTSTSVLPVVNYHKSLSDERNMYLSAGFSAGMVQRKFDLSKMTTNSQFNGTDYDATLGTGETVMNSNYLYFDGSTGISFNSQIGENPENNFYVGLAYHHFNRNANMSFYANDKSPLNPKWVYSGGLRTAIDNYSFVTFYGDYSAQGPYSEIIGGMIYSRKLDEYPDDPQYVISGGAFLRWKDAIVPMLKLQTSPLVFGLSYDVNISPLKASSQYRGGFEVSVSYQNFLDRDNTTKNAVRCPNF